MILFLGIRPGKPSQTSLKGIPCPHCGQQGTLTLVSRPNYFHIFWIPLFTINTSCYIECSHCLKVFDEKSFTPAMQRALPR